MTCHFIIGEDGSRMIVCTRGERPDEMTELKKAMTCRKWEICSKCESYETCQRVLAKRKEREGERHRHGVYTSTKE